MTESNINHLIDAVTAMVILGAMLAFYAYIIRQAR
jgi:hypothetical protein